MKRSDEESLDEVRKEAPGDGSHPFEGVISTVLPSHAEGGVHVFTTSKDFDYRNPRVAECELQSILDAGRRPARTRKLINDGTYRSPLGFLSAVREVVERALARRAEARRELRKLKGLDLDYVFNGRHHTLTVEKARFHKKFRLKVREGGVKRKHEFANIAELHFRAGSGNRKGHAFALWIPLQGKLAGIPIRIVDRPRWWLKVELNLDLAKVECSTCEPPIGPSSAW